MHRATVLLWVSTVVAFCVALIAGGAVGAEAEITASIPAGVPMWGPGRDLAWFSGSPLGFTVLASQYLLFYCLMFIRYSTN